MQPGATDLLGNKRWVGILFIVLIYLRFLWVSGLGVLIHPNIDLPSFYCAAKIHFQLGLPIYGDFALQSCADILKLNVYPYLYPPVSIFLFWPLASLTYDSAKLMVLVVNHFLILWLFFQVFKQLKLFSNFPFWQVLAFLLITIYEPLVMTIEHGQVNILLLNLILLAYILESKRRSIISGMLIGMSSLIKVYPALLIVSQAISKNWRIFWSSLITIFLITSLSLIFLPLDSWIAWFNLAANRGYWVLSDGHPANQSVNAWAIRLFLGGANYQALIPDGIILARTATVVILLAIGIISLKALTKKVLSAKDSLINLSIMLTLLFIVPPVAWVHHAVWVLPGVLIIFERLTNSKINWPLGIGLFGVALLSLRLPFHESYLQTTWLSLFISNKFYGAVMVWFSLVRLRLDSGDRSLKSM